MAGDPGNPSGARRRRGLAAVVVIAVMLVSAPAIGAQAADVCNGSAALCDRPLGTVAFATSHNAMASSANHFRGPNQTTTIPAQLRHGIRGMQLDVYEGTRKGGSVYTDFSGPYAKLASDLPPSLVAAGRAAHRRLGAPPPGTPTDVYMCHGFCELGAIRFSTVADQIQRFLDENPRDVLAIVFEDHLSSARIADALNASGLAPMLLPVDAGQPLPTLGAMIASGQRVFATLENGDGGPTLRNAFAGLVEETPFTFVRPNALRAASSCAANRGDDSAPVFQFNHWLTPPQSATAGVVNSRSLLGGRVERCEVARGRGPTLVAVDFVERGALLSVVDDLNRQ
jgi:hypothetical protein